MFLSFHVVLKYISFNAMFTELDIKFYIHMRNLVKDLSPLKIYAQPLNFGLLYSMDYMFDI